MPNKIEVAKQELAEKFRSSGPRAVASVEIFKDVASERMLQEAIWRILLKDVVEIAERHNINLENWCSGKTLADMARQQAARSVELMFDTTIAA